MKFRMLAAAATVAGVIGFAGASEAKVYNFMFIGGPVSGSGKLTTADDSTVSSTVVSAVGTIVDTEISPTGFKIDGLSLYAGADNIIYPSAVTSVDMGGVSFTTVGGGDFNLGLGGGGGSGYLLNAASINPGGGAGVPGSYDVNLDISAVPELSAWALMLAGIGGLGLALRRVRARAVLPA